MDDEWQFQLRLDVSAGLAADLRDGATPDALRTVLERQSATLECQFDAFKGYVDEAEARGIDAYPLYAWTKATIDDPVKKAKYQRVFTVYVAGEEVYGGTVADALQADLSALGDDMGIERISRFDTNPANNPQPPAR